MLGDGKKVAGVSGHQVGTAPQQGNFVIDYQPQQRQLITNCVQGVSQQYSDRQKQMQKPLVIGTKTSIGADVNSSNQQQCTTKLHHNHSAVSNNTNMARMRTSKPLSQTEWTVSMGPHNLVHVDT